MYHLGTVHESQERYDEAEALFKRTLAGQEMQLGTKNPDVLMTAHSLANIYQLQERYNEAEALFKQALAGEEMQCGTTHPYTLMTVSCLAEVYKLQERYDEAEILFMRVLTCKLGDEHLDTLIRTVYGLAEVYKMQERYDEAEALFKQESRPFLVPTGWLMVCRNIELLLLLFCIAIAPSATSILVAVRLFTIWLLRRNKW
jgi:tetratricopeptide (TPR) repeat protein